MKKLLLIILVFLCQIAEAQNIGIGTTAPATKLDVAGNNNWNVSAGEGDVRIGNPSYRLKFGVALSGGGAGAANIMQYGQPGGFNVLSLGAQGSQILFVNGGSASVGVGTISPTSLFQVNGTTTTNNIILNGTGNGNTNDFLVKSNANGLVSARKGHGGLGLNYLICLTGVFIGPNNQGSINDAWLGEIKLFAANYAPAGWAFCNGQLLQVANNTALFAIIGTYYGGDGVTTFGLPDLRGAAPVGFGTPAAGGNTWDLAERTQ
jgi:microcystin-dependent protein